MKKIILAFSIFVCATAPALAAQGGKNIYFGGGVNSNELDPFDNATGFQLFAGYLLDVGVKDLDFSIEGGYWDSGDFEQPLPFGLGTVKASANGLWGTGVARYRATDTVGLIGRLGYDFGDDDGFMVGAGVGFRLSKSFELRGEYVARDSIDSLQLNLVFYP